WGERRFSYSRRIVFARNHKTGGHRPPLQRTLANRFDSSQPRLTLEKLVTLDSIRQRCCAVLCDFIIFARRTKFFLRDRMLFPFRGHVSQFLEAAKRRIYGAA